jgi:glycine cleavage system H protein
MNFDNVRFTKDHEWVRLEGDEATVGITDFAAGELGDVVYVELPTEGTEITQGESMGTIEAVKTVADLYAPATGTVTAVNPALEDDPALVNSSPYEDGWFVRMRLADATQFEELMTHAAYQEMVGQ